MQVNVERFSLRMNQPTLQTGKRSEAITEFSKLATKEHQRAFIESDWFMSALGGMMGGDPFDPTASHRLKLSTTVTQVRVCCM